MGRGRYAWCSYCNNMRHGAAIFRCLECGQVFCEDCSRPFIWHYCPSCGGRDTGTRMGAIDENLANDRRTPDSVLIGRR